jgi:hypothetical protein
VYCFRPREHLRLFAACSHAFPHIVLSHLATSRSQRQYDLVLNDFTRPLAPHPDSHALALISPRLAGQRHQQGRHHQPVIDLRIRAVFVFAALNIAGPSRGIACTDPSSRHRIANII